MIEEKLHEKVDVSSVLDSMGCKHKIPSIHVTREDDGSFILEWIFGNHTRIGLNIETNPDEHGWHVVSKQITVCGPLELGERREGA